MGVSSAMEVSDLLMETSRLVDDEDDEEKRRRRIVGRGYICTIKTEM